MKKSTRYLLGIVLVLLSVSGLLAQRDKPIPIIFDSDMGPDYDDAGAITMLHALADSGKVNILATVASTKYEGVAAVFDVFNTFYNRPEIPIGVPKGNASVQKDFQHWTDSLIRKFPHRINVNADVPDAVDVYRKTLASSPDHSVTIITVGFLTNLSNLLQSQPDRYSKLNGLALVTRKVKRLVSMAGAFPSGSEYNVRIDAPASIRVFSQWPTPVILSGVEIGRRITTGIPLIKNKRMLHTPAQEAFSISIPLDPNDVNGRCSWDETAVLVAVNGYSPYYTLVHGRMIVAEDGSNTWDTQLQGHSYLVEKVKPDVVKKIIDDMIMHVPTTTKKIISN